VGGEVERLIKERNSINAEKNIVCAEDQALSVQNDELSGTAIALELKITTLSAEHSNMEAKLRVLNDSYGKLKDDHALKDAQLTAMTAERDDLQGRVTTLTAESDDLQGQVGAITGEKDNVSTENAQLKEEVTTLQKEVKNGILALDKYKKRVRALGNEH